MRFDVLTLFPEMFSGILGDSIMGRAQENNIISINTINIRDFSKDKHHRVDDYPYGGGSGMVMQPQPIYDALLSVTEKLDYKPRVIFMTPSGKTFNQKIAKELSKEEHIIILCGHYEGVDQRIIDKIVTDEISIGDYVLTGGEIAAMAVIDSVSRLIPGVLGNDESLSEESFTNDLLEYPQYTRPPVWMGQAVPKILLSGDHKYINGVRRRLALVKTLKNRPDIIKEKRLSPIEKKFVSDYYNFFRKKKKGLD